MSEEHIEQPLEEAADAVKGAVDPAAENAVDAAEEVKETAREAVEEVKEEVKESNKEAGSIIDEVPGEGAAAGGGAAVEERKPNIFKRFFGWLFNKESKFGRFMRGCTRIVGFAAVLFLAGFLLAYFLLYQPAMSSLDFASQNIQDMEQQLSLKQEEVVNLNGQVTNLRATATVAAGIASSEKLRSNLLVALNQVSAARLALTRRDGAGAKTAINLAVARIEEVKPDLDLLDALASETLLSRLDLAENGLVTDPTTAAKDMVLASEGLEALIAKLAAP